MKTVLTLFLAACLPFAAIAQDAPAATEAPGLEVLDAADLSLDQFLWIQRPVVVFADTAADPSFARQMRLLAADPAALALRDVVVIADTDPTGQSAIRTRLRPRGFALVLIDKDGDVKLRKPLPWDVREITHAIDKFPLRRQEMLEQMPSGR